jgi:hypothetical protein
MALIGHNQTLIQSDILKHHPLITTASTYAAAAVLLVLSATTAGPPASVAMLPAGILPNEVLPHSAPQPVAAAVAEVAVAGPAAQQVVAALTQVLLPTHGAPAQLHTWRVATHLQTHTAGTNQSASHRKLVVPIAPANKLAVQLLVDTCGAHEACSG